MKCHDSEFTLPIAAERPSLLIRSRGHTPGRDDPDVRWVDTKPLFRVRLRLVSSVFTTEQRLQTFFQASFIKFIVIIIFSAVKS